MCSLLSYPLNQALVIVEQCVRRKEKVARDLKRAGSKEPRALTWAQQVRFYKEFEKSDLSAEKNWSEFQEEKRLADEEAEQAEEEALLAEGLIEAAAEGPEAMSSSAGGPHHHHGPQQSSDDRDPRAIAAYLTSSRGCKRKEKSFGPGLRKV